MTTVTARVALTRSRKVPGMLRAVLDEIRTPLLMYVDAHWYPAGTRHGTPRRFGGLTGVDRAAQIINVA